MHLTTQEQLSSVLKMASLLKKWSDKWMKGFLKHSERLSTVLAVRVGFQSILKRADSVIFKGKLLLAFSCFDIHILCAV